MATTLKSTSASVALLLLLLRSPFLSNKLSFDYIFQFGDSINDVGNLHWDDDNSLCNHYPYGLSLLDSGALPRCSDGLLMIDYFAKYFNLSINPYLAKGDDFSQGINFAVAGSTALNSSTLRTKHIISPFTNNSLSIQLKWFKSHLKSFCNGTLDCQNKLGKSLVFVGEIGGNDYNYEIMFSKPIEEVYKLVPDVILAITDAAKELINEGVKTMVLAGNFPIGCLPIYKTLYKTNDTTKYDDQNCLKELNDFATFHNHHLQIAIQELRQNYPQVTILYADYFSAFKWTITNAPSLGFDKDEIQKACCGDGRNEYNFNVSRFCGNEGSSVCVNPSKRIYWDGLHLTQHAYQHMAHWLLHRIAPNIVVNNNLQVA